MYDLETMDKRLIIFGNLFLIANRLQAAMDSKMADITAKQWFLIMMLGMFDEPPTLKELARMCDSSHQNIKQIALKLQAKGFVRIEKDPKDARALRISATAKCAEWDAMNAEASARFIDAMFGDLTREEISILNGSLFKIYERLEKIQNETHA